MHCTGCCRRLTFSKVAFSLYHNLHTAYQCPVRRLSLLLSHSLRQLLLFPHRQRAMFWQCQSPCDASEMAPSFRVERLLCRTKCAVTIDWTANQGGVRAAGWTVSGHDTTEERLLCWAASEVETEAAAVNQRKQKKGEMRLDGS